MKDYIVWAIVVLVLVGAVFGIIRVAKAPTSGIGSIPPVSESDETRGPKDARVVVVEYSDFQCPACAAFFPTVEDLNEEIGDKILFVYRNFPLPQHQNAELAAYAAEAAGKQGKFWEMHAVLFTGQNDWAESQNAKEIFTGYAKELGLDLNVFGKDIDSEEVKDKISGDQLGGQKARVDRTPTFFLNGKIMEGYQSYDEFKNQIREAVRNNS